MPRQPRAFGPLQSFLTPDGTALLLPAVFAGHPRLVAFGGAADKNAAKAQARALTSATPEPISYWRELWESTATLRDQVSTHLAPILDKFNDARYLAQAKVAGKATLDALAGLRAHLDHMRVMLPADRQQWTAFHHELHRRFVPLFNDYVQMTTAIYGNSFPLDSVSRQPVLAGEFAHFPAVGEFGRSELFHAHELDGVVFGAALQSAAGYADWLTGEGGDLVEQYCRMLSPEDDFIPDYCARYGIFPVPATDDEGRPVARWVDETGLEPLTATIIVIGLVALTVAGLAACVYFAGKAISSYKAAAAQAAWADTAAQCIAGGGDPAACTKAGADAAGNVTDGQTANKIPWVPIVLGSVGILAAATALPQLLKQTRE